MFPPGTEIDASRSHYATSQDALRLAGFVDTGNPDTAQLIWIDGVITMDEAERVRSTQRVNKIPCMNYICYKSTLFSELNRLRASFPTTLDIYPPTYLLPSEYPEFQHFHTTLCAKLQSAPFWVVKPRIGCCGRGIHLIQSAFEASTITAPSIAQLMVDPLLLDGVKFDFRLFLLIASLQPFACFIYREGIARFCASPYEAPTKATRGDRLRNLTNTAVNLESRRPPEEFTRPASDALLQLLRCCPRTARLWGDIRDACRVLLASLYPTIMATLPRKCGDRAPRAPPARRFFHILGVDIIVDVGGRPRVLELNDRPSLSVTVPFERELKTGLIREALFHVAADGAARGEHAESGWQQLLPLRADEEGAAALGVIMRTQSPVRYTGRLAADGPAVERMITGGVKAELHQELRERAMQLKEDGKLPRFRHYLKTGKVGLAWRG